MRGSTASEAVAPKQAFVAGMALLLAVQLTSVSAAQDGADPITRFARAAWPSGGCSPLYSSLVLTDMAADDTALARGCRTRSVVSADMLTKATTKRWQS
jgi:hypothetical protein